MSEKIKGIFGSETRAGEVLKWLKSQGAETCAFNGNAEDGIYYADKGKVKMLDKAHSVLFDIVELPRWRAGKRETYYFVDSCIQTVDSTDIGSIIDEGRYKMGQLFQDKGRSGTICKENP